MSTEEQIETCLYKDFLRETLLPQRAFAPCPQPDLTVKAVKKLHTKAEKDLRRTRNGFQREFLKKMKAQMEENKKADLEFKKLVEVNEKASQQKTKAFDSDLSAQRKEFEKTWVANMRNMEKKSAGYLKEISSRESEDLAAALQKLKESGASKKEQEAEKKRLQKTVKTYASSLNILEKERAKSDYEFEKIENSKKFTLEQLEALYQFKRENLIGDQLTHLSLVEKQQIATLARAIDEMTEMVKQRKCELERSMIFYRDFLEAHLDSKNKECAAELTALEKDIARGQKQEMVKAQQSMRNK
eukprot:CAMPEP_0177672018 /NCGR_PEP_ID=MMETSP0447-20121125/25074_1 /TAXON_ID=0 /ORGANISM="Stygamoeba regulata, Strain BSH-02190019" /LENGTH=300 /DNA_ID=CAMNT_0019179571 /DNA_START=128 /DNA_END=1027 /DNA_ORIENTATION=+